MKWHHDQCFKNEAFRHLVDSQAWKLLDELYISFDIEPCNVRLRLASDGFNLLENMNNAYSIWLGSYSL